MDPLECCFIVNTVNQLVSLFVPLWVNPPRLTGVVFFLKKVADQPVRGREGHALLTRLPLQAQTAPAAAVPIAAGERRQVTAPR